MTAPSTTQGPPLRADGVPFWLRPVADLRDELSAAERGLDVRVVEERRRALGPNELLQSGREGPGHRYLGHLRNPLVLLLLAACGVSAALGDVASAMVIAAIVLASVSLDVLQEHRAGRAAEGLRRSVALRSLVLRGGR